MKQRKASVLYQNKLSDILDSKLTSSIHKFRKSSLINKEEHKKLQKNVIVAMLLRRFENTFKVRMLPNNKV